MIKILFIYLIILRQVSLCSQWYLFLGCRIHQQSCEDMDAGTRCAAVWWLSCELIWVWEAEGGSYVLRKGGQTAGDAENQPSQAAQTQSRSTIPHSCRPDSWDQNIGTYIKDTKVWYNTVLWRIKTVPEVTLVLFTSTLGYCLNFMEEVSIVCADEKLVFKILLLQMHVCHSTHVLAKG